MSIDTGTRTRDLLWSDVSDIYRSVLDHPFVTGLTDGSLPHETFRHYIVQDAHYLRGYARALAICAAKAPGENELAMFAEHAAGAISAEQELHDDLLGGLGLTSEQAAALPVAPATRAYVSYLLATAYGGSYAEAVAAVLPCYWIYGRVGEHLLAAGSPDPLYQRWIAMYGGEEFGAVVDAVLDATDRIGALASERELGLMREHFTTTSRYEWMFWDGAFRRETWPV
ncbi:thiaminase/transcriptional activator TenA [Pseudonocardia sediminis]|uniref:Aminopyrimidine aminohydrolase n=1 Tax=Pseudonocardia sediminis TaxID=1397368 RepID=A0A4Q7V263_PSEST|nr:thiaminase II [Pseudonocardia sediminis]RZT88446.1 thiaminase/transcriptional activator TenA [Pseudonocardia sediminis]